MAAPTDGPDIGKLTSIKADGSRLAIHPLDVKGRFITRRRWVFAVLMGIYVALPLIPLAWAGLHMVRSGASYPGGRLNDHLGPSAGILVGAAIYGATLYALAIAASPLASMGAFLALGLAAGATESAERTLVARLSPRRQGRGFGGYHAVTGFAALPAALLFGAAYAHAAGTALTLSAGLTMVSAVLWVVVGRRIPVPTR